MNIVGYRFVLVSFFVPLMMIRLGLMAVCLSMLGLLPSMTFAQTVSSDPAVVLIKSYGFDQNTQSFFHARVFQGAIIRNKSNVASLVIPSYMVFEGTDGSAHPFFDVCRTIESVMTCGHPAYLSHIDSEKGLATLAPYNGRSLPASLPHQGVTPAGESTVSVVGYQSPDEVPSHGSIYTQYLSTDTRSTYTEGLSNSILLPGTLIRTDKGVVAMMAPSYSQSSLNPIARSALAAYLNTKRDTMPNPLNDPYPLEQDFIEYLGVLKTSLYHSTSFTVPHIKLTQRGSFQPKEVKYGTNYLSYVYTLQNTKKTQLLFFHFPVIGTDIQKAQAQQIRRFCENAITCKQRPFVIAGKNTTMAIAMGREGVDSKYIGVLWIGGDLGMQAIAMQGLSSDIKGLTSALTLLIKHLRVSTSAADTERNLTSKSIYRGGSEIQLDSTISAMIMPSNPIDTLVIGSTEMPGLNAYIHQGSVPSTFVFIDSSEYLAKELPGIGYPQKLSTFDDERTTIIDDESGEGAILFGGLILVHDNFYHKVSIMIPYHSSQNITQQQALDHLKRTLKAMGKSRS